MESDAPSPPASDYDQTLKRLFTKSPDGVLAFLAPNCVWQSVLSPELPAAIRRADLAWAVQQPDGRPGILHIEMQTEIAQNIGERVAEYALRLYLRDHEEAREEKRLPRPVHSIVIFLRPGGKVPDPVFGWDWAGQPCYRCYFETIRLWERQPEEVLQLPYPTLWPLAGLMGAVSVDTTLAVADHIQAGTADKEVSDELTRDLVLLAGIRLPWEEIYDAMRRRPMIEDLWEKSSLAKALTVLAEERGEARGKLEGMRISAKLALDTRFGPLSEDMLDALRSADEATCVALLAHLDEPIEQARARLGLG